MTTRPEEKPATLAVHAGGHGTLLAFRPQTLSEAMELAGHMAKSDLVPKEYRGKPENVLIAMQLGAEVGLSPFQALQSIAVINGRPGIYGDAGLGIVMASGLLEKHDEQDDPTTEGGQAYCMMKRKNGRTVEHTFSHQDAQNVTMYERDANGNLRQGKLSDRAMWKSFPKRMRQMRARWWVMRDLFPDVLKGLVGREEHESDSTPIPPTAAVIEADFQEMMPREKSRDPGAEPDQAPDNGEGLAVDAPAAPAVDAPAAKTEAPAPSTPLSEAPPTPAPPPPPATRGTTFEINGVSYHTAGITKAQLQQALKLAPKVDAKHGKGYATKLILAEFQVQTRVDLTEEQAERYLVRLGEILSAS